MKKKSSGNKGQSEVKAPKRRRFVAGLIEGKSMRKAALDAGYTQSMADNASHRIMPGAQEEFKAELGRKIPHAVLVKRIAEGLDAKETKFAQMEGNFTDRRDLVAWGIRLRYAELAAKLLGFLVERVELGQSDEGPLNFNVNLQFVDGGDDGDKSPNS